MQRLRVARLGAAYLRESQAAQKLGPASIPETTAILTQEEQQPRASTSATHSPWATRAYSSPPLHFAPSSSMPCSRCGCSAMHHALRQHHCHAAAAAKERAEASRPPPTLADVEKACWSCDHFVKKGGLICNSCETIQPPESNLNYFQLFGLPARGVFDVDPVKLEQRYKRLQFALHPDKLGHKPAEEQQFSAQHASNINMAYSVLKQPLARANYLLAMRGINSGDNFEGTMQDPELLMEVLEAREEVEEAAQDTPRLRQLLETNRTKQACMVGVLSAAFRANDLEGALAATTQLTYLTRLEVEIVNKLPSL